MDPPSLDDDARDALRREQAEYAERLALTGHVGPEQRLLFEDAEHRRHFERLQMIFQDLSERRGRAV
jgi:hypothetical protein